MCGTVGTGESTTHCCPQGPGTSVAFTCITIECPTQAPIEGGGGGGWEFQMTGALILLVTLLLF